MSSRLVKIWIRISVGRVTRVCFGGHGGGSGDWLKVWRVRRFLRCPKDILRRSSIFSDGSRAEDVERRRCSTGEVKCDQRGVWSLPIYLIDVRSY